MMSQDQKAPEKPKHKFSTPHELLKLFSLTGFLYGPVDDRLHVKDALEKALKKPVPYYVNYWYCFGGITFLLFCIQVVTGVLLMMYYRPTIAEAYASVVNITNNIHFGWLIRGIHHWAANLMIVTLLIHMGRVYWHGAYKPPRDFNWIVGIMLMGLTFVFGFTGYLLPWTQLSFWATTVGTEIPSAVPYFGDALRILARGGEEVTQITLTRFFALHVMLLPALTTAFLVTHFLILRRQGISKPL